MAKRKKQDKANKAKKATTTPETTEAKKVASKRISLADYKWGYCTKSVKMVELIEKAAAKLDKEVLAELNRWKTWFSPVTEAGVNHLIVGFKAMAEAAGDEKGYAATVRALTTRTEAFEKATA